MMAVWQRNRNPPIARPGPEVTAVSHQVAATVGAPGRARGRHPGALIAAARRLFAAHGFDGTGTEQIVAEARVTRGALYHHFRDKADLFRAVMAEAAGDVAQRLIDEQLAAEATVADGGDPGRGERLPRRLRRRRLPADRAGRRPAGARRGGLGRTWSSATAAACSRSGSTAPLSTGDLDAMPVRALARLLIAMLTEASLAIARSSVPAQTGRSSARCWTACSPAFAPSGWLARVARGSRRQGAETLVVSRRVAAQGALTLGALGVVFGDIGTSPLYTVQTLFAPSDPHPVKVSHDSIFGVISLIFWAVTIIVTVTYVLLVMRADNDGEGGIMALIALIRRRALPGGRRAKAILAGLGIFGASLFFGDSMITPAISVLSAVEGVKVAAPSVSGLVIPITVVIIIALFMGQRLGTSAVGRVFGPVMAVWFTTLAVLGIKGIIGHPVILEALSPTYAIGFLAGHFATAFFSLTAVVLAVTGAEALYADMGHFGRGPVRRAWLLLVFPPAS